MSKPRPLTDSEQRQFITDFDSGKIKDEGSNRIRRDHYERGFAEAEQRKAGMVDIMNCFLGLPYQYPNRDWRIKQ